MKHGKDDGLRSATAGVTTDGGVVPDVETDENLLANLRERQAGSNECIVCGSDDPRFYLSMPSGLICGGPFHDPVERTTNQTREAVSRPSTQNGPQGAEVRQKVDGPFSSISDAVDPVLVSLCVERGAEALYESWRAGSTVLLPWTELDVASDLRYENESQAEVMVRAVVPLLLEAGAKAERERVKARAEELRPSKEQAFNDALWGSYDQGLTDLLASITEEGKGEDA